MKMKKILSIILPLALCLTMAVPAPTLAANGQEEGQEIQEASYVENEAIVCYVDPADVNENALEEQIEEIASGETDEGVESDNPGEDVVNIEAEEGLKLVDMVESSDSLMNLGNKPINKMKGVDKNVIKNKKVKSGKAKQKIGLVKSKKYSTEELVNKLNELPNVEYASPNYIEKPLATDSTGKQWAYNGNGGNAQYGLNVPEWNNSSNVNAPGVVVAVIDTGVNYNHEDLKDVMWSDGNTYNALTALGGGEYGINTFSAANSTNPMDENGHGSHCAGIIGAAWNEYGVSGAANGVKIMAIKAGKDDFTSDALISGMNYVLAAKQAGVNVVAVNNSWGGGYRSSDPGYASAMQKLGEAGVISVFASGNESADCDGNYGTGGGQHYLAYFFKDLTCKLIVNNSDKYGTPSGTSNWGATTTDVYAPGSDIYSTVVNGYGYKSGTSMASPAVVGEVAILRAMFPNATVQQVIQAVKNNVTTNNGKLKGCVSNGYANVGMAIDGLGNITHGVDTKPWSYDASNHWKDCNVGECEVNHKHMEGAHSWVTVQDNILKCSVCDAIKYGESTLMSRTEIDATASGNATIVSALNAIIPTTMQGNGANIKYLNISIQTDASPTADGYKIIIPYSWFMDSGFVAADARYYDFSVAHMIDENNVEAPAITITDAGLEITVASFSPFAVAFKEKTVSIGDLDADGNLDGDDLIILRSALTANTMTGKQKVIANYNQSTDGVVNINDAIDLRNAINGGLN